VIHNGVSGHLDTNIENLIARMRELLCTPQDARRLGEGARRLAQERFSIQRFARDWEKAFAHVAGGVGAVRVAAPSSEPAEAFS